MQLIVILLITVSVLTLLSGVTVFLGSSKGDRLRSAWFFIATIFAAIWTVSISMFLIAEPSWKASIDLPVRWTYLSSIFIDIALLGYISWREKYGKIVTLAFLIGGIILSAVFINNPGLLYTDVILSNTGNSLVTNIGPFYFIYITFFCLLVPAVILTLLKQIIKPVSKKKRGGDLVLLIGFAISGTMSLIFCLILPLWRWDLVWLGPLAVSTTIIAFYYSILRYRVLNLSSIWLKILSYIVIMASSAVIYMVIFSIIFALLFRGSTPSTEVIILNFIMILIVLLLFPAMNELNMFVNSLISTQDVDMIYIIKKLNKFTPRTNSDLKELADFLADHMHFESVNFLIDKQIYGSIKNKITSDEVEIISRLGDPENGIWQNIDENDEKWLRHDFSAIAALRDSNGQTFGQMIIGKPIGKINFNQRDIIQIESAINMVATTISSRNHPKRTKRS
ncbi:hypothetical protein IJJ05_00550 [Candidatus Saccharibacteria bacterium]|nr:hypothetical protein [Candidatus Saccharibacteria bacterium]